MPRVSPGGIFGYCTFVKLYQGYHGGVEEETRIIKKVVYTCRLIHYNIYHHLAREVLGICSIAYPSVFLINL